MLRPLLIYTLIFSFVFSLFIALGQIVGSSIEARVVAALVAPTPLNPYDAQIDSITLIDLGRLLRVTHTIPIPNIKHVEFSTFNHLIVTTYSGTFAERPYRGGLHHYNFITGDLQTIDTFESNQRSASNSGAYHNYSTTFLPDDRVMFLDPEDFRLHIYDFTSEQVTVLEALELREAYTPEIRWSYDSSQVMVKQADTLYVLNRDGTNLREKKFAGPDFSPQWTESGKYIWIQYYGTIGNTPFPRNGPPQLLHAADFSEVEAARQMDGVVSGMWGCEDRWISQRFADEDDATQVYLINPETGEKIHINEVVPYDIGITDVWSWSPTGCEHLIVTASSAQSTPLWPGVNFAISSYYQLQLSDDAKSAKSFELLVEDGALINFTGEKVIYQKPHPDSDRKTIQIFRKPLNPPGEPELIGEYRPMQALWMGWSEDVSFALYLERTNSLSFGGTLRMLDLRSGQNHRLTDPDEYLENFRIIEDYSIHRTLWYTPPDDES